MLKTPAIAEMKMLMRAATVNQNSKVVRQKTKTMRQKVMNSIELKGIAKSSDNYLPDHKFYPLSVKVLIVGAFKTSDYGL